MKIPFSPEENRRYTAEEIREAVRREYDLELVDGFSQPLLEESQAEEQNWPVASFKHIYRAWKISGSEQDRFAWLTGKVPEDIGKRDGAVIFPIATGWGGSYPQPSVWFEYYIDDHLLIRFRPVKYPELWQQNGASLYYDVKRVEVPPQGTGLKLDSWIAEGRMASFGIAILRVPRRYLIPGQKARLEVKARSYFPSKNWLRIDQAFKKGEQKNIDMLAWETGLQRVVEGRQPLVINGQNLYFGDIHAHSFCGFESPCGRWDEQKRNTCTGCELTGRGNGCGWGTVNANYIYARDVANLDFFTLSEHDFQMPGDLWSRRKEIAGDYNRDGRFVVINGYEHTSWAYGHRNVYFRGDDPALFPASPNLGGYNRKPQKPPEDLWAYLEENNEVFFTVPHHTSTVSHPFCWGRFDPEYDKNVEIFSGWGSSEMVDTHLNGDGNDKYPHLTVREALSNDLSFGFVAASDAHDGCPGNAQGISIFNWANKYSRVGSGRTVVSGDRLTREDVYQSIADSRCYATTGAPILLDFRVNGQQAGSQIRTSGTRKINCSIVAPAGIDEIELVKNGKSLVKERGMGQNEEFALTDQRQGSRDTYYLRVILEDMETAWASPITVRG